MSWTARLMAGAQEALEQHGMTQHREEAGTLWPGSFGRNREQNLSAEQGGSAYFRPFAPEDWERNTPEIRRAQDKVLELWYLDTTFKAVHKLPASYVAGSGKIRYKAQDPAVQELLDDAASDPGNTLLYQPRRDYIRYRLLGMAPYLYETMPNGEVIQHYQDARYFDGCAFWNKNDGLMEWVQLCNTLPFVDALSELVSTPEGPRVLIRSQVPEGQAFFKQGYVGSKHRCIRRRKLPDSQRAAFDMAYLGPIDPPRTRPWPQLRDGCAMVMMSNTEGSSLGAPQFIAAINDVMAMRDTWRNEIKRVRSIRQVFYRYWHKIDTPEIAKMKRDGWRPQDGYALFLKFINQKGDLTDFDVVSPPLNIAETSEHFRQGDMRIFREALIPITWAAAPEERVLAALAQESPAIMNMKADRGEFENYLYIDGAYRIDTARMMRRIPLRASSNFTVEMDALQAEDAGAHFDRLEKLARFLSTCSSIGAIPPAVTRVIVREGLETENVIDAERYMRAIGLTVNDDIPESAPIEPGLLGPPEGRPQDLTDASQKKMGIKVVQRELMDFARKDPKGAAALIKGIRLHTSGNGDGREGKVKADIDLNLTCPKCFTTPCCCKVPVK